MSVSNPCLFWRHNFKSQALLSRWEYEKLKLDRPTNQGDIRAPPGCGTTFNKSGRHCKPSEEINLICLMYLDYLDLCVTCAIVGQTPSSTYQVLRVCVCALDGV